MTYLSTEFVQFFQELAQNNNTEWFKNNKSRYETHVKIPFERLITDLIAGVRKINPAFPAFKASECTYRINRDIRFSTDKSPYKNHAGAFLCVGGKKKTELPGFYLHVSDKECFTGGGCYYLSKNNLTKVRRHIYFNPAALEKIAHDPQFLALYPESIQGERLKKIPAEYSETFNQTPYIANKQFYCIATIPTDIITKPDFLDTILTYYQTSLPLINFLHEAMTID